MDVKQASSIINTAAAEIGAETNVVSENLDFVDNGATLAALIADDSALDNFVKSIHQHIGKVVFADDRAYQPYSLGLKRDSWSFGGLLQKVYIDLPAASDNDTFSLVSGETYDDILVYSPPTVSEKFFAKVAPWEIKMSYPDAELIRRTFSNAEQASAYVNAVENQITRARDFYNSLTEQRTVNSLVLEKAKGGKVINLLAAYNATVAEADALTANACISNPAFLRFAAAEIAKYSDFMATMSTAFNDGGYYKQTPKEFQKFFVLSEFARNVEVYSESDTYHNEFVKLIDNVRVPAWQGTKYESRKFDFETCSTVLGKPASGSDNAILCTGILGVLMDRDAAAICCERYRVTSFFNAGNETMKYYHKWDARYITDTNENVIVFGVWDVENANVVELPAGDNAEQGDGTRTTKTVKK